MRVHINSLEPGDGSRTRKKAIRNVADPCRELPMLRNARKMPEISQSWIITGPTMVSSIWSMLALPSQNGRNEREAMFLSMYKGRKQF